jgi:hypothetical protein
MRGEKVLWLLLLLLRLLPSTSSSSSRSTRLPVDPALCWRLGSKGSTTIDSVPFISARQKGQPTPSDSCKVIKRQLQIMTTSGTAWYLFYTHCSYLFVLFYLPRVQARSA